MKETQASNARLAEVLDGYIRALEAGNAPPREALLAAHKDLAEDLEAALLGLEFVRGAAPSLDGKEEIGRSLGDYRLVREIGRGGMAVVYEAEQISLGRRVALKVLPFAAVLDPKQLQRFKNEALAAAHLRHSNIVPVYGVGCERGVHYYAMQYVEGQSLALAIRDLKGGGGPGSSDDTRPGSTGEEAGSPDGPRTPISSHGSNREPAYIRMAAQLGVQAAEALDHAHQLGIVHRDVKPGNLLVDRAGTLWVTDFGLARSLHDAGLTVTGELLGTVRYMSPEQALAKRMPIDHRTDVYSLGATLYELFTFEPAFPGDDPHVVIQDIAAREPVPPRRLNPALPRDLETVILKAMSKDPATRYATAQEMADDLKRCLEDQPILARRPSVVARAAKWSRRHRGLATASLVLLLLGVAALVADHVRVADQRNRAETNLRIARDAIDKFLFVAGIAEGEDRPLPPPAQRALLEGALRFCEAHLDDREGLGKQAKILHELHRYGEALSALDRILASDPRDALVLTHRGHMLWHLERFDDALAALDTAISAGSGSSEPHFFRGMVLSSLGRHAEAVAAYREVILRSPGNAPTHFNLGNTLYDSGDITGAIGSYREAIRLRPQYAKAHAELSAALLKNGEVGEAIRECREAIRLEPDAELRNNLGLALDIRGDRDDAIREYREAIWLNADLAPAHYNLGNALAGKGDSEGAIREYREAVRLLPHHAREAGRESHEEFAGKVHHALGAESGKRGDLEEAIRNLREAARFRPGFAASHHLLGLALLQRGDYEEAIAACREALRLEPDDAEAYCNLGVALESVGRTDEAIAAYRDVIRLTPDDPDGLCNLGLALTQKGCFKEALPLLRKGHEVGSKRGGWTYPSAEWVQSAEQGAELEERVDQMLAGGAPPRDAADRIAFAGLLRGKERFRDATRIWVEAFAADATLAGDLASFHRYNAACCAAIAATHDREQAAEWRAHALEWLRADLAARQKAATGLADMLKHWKGDPDLASVRDHIDDMPGPERGAWRSFWAEVDDALKAAPPAAK